MGNTDTNAEVLEDITLEEAFALLEEKLENLESDEISLEESFKVYKDGMDLLRKCYEKIDYVEKKVLEINEAGDIVEFQSEDE